MSTGPKSMALFREKILASKTVIWNGPAGVFEFDNFGKGTKHSGEKATRVCVRVSYSKSILFRIRLGFVNTFFKKQ